MISFLSVFIKFYYRVIDEDGFFFLSWSRESAEANKASSVMSILSWLFFLC